MKAIHCHDCDQIVSNDEIALNMKLFGKYIGTYRCNRCLSEALGCEVERLEKMVSYYKNSGCNLFQIYYTD
jgi:hypothetical protein